MSPEIVFDGPKDKSDPTTVLEIPSDDESKPNVRLPLGLAVDVSAAEAKRAKDVDGMTIRAAKAEDEKAPESETTSGGNQGGDGSPDNGS